MTGEAPVVDMRSSRAQVQFGAKRCEALPGAGRLNMVSTVLPGATLTTGKRPRRRRPERPHADALQRARRAGGAADHRRDEPADREPDVRACSSSTS